MDKLKFKTKTYYVLVLQVILVFTYSTYADEEVHGPGEGKKHIHGVHKECPLPKSSIDIISCALEFHPSIIKSNLKIDSTSKLEAQASQLINPALSSRYVKKDDMSELETNLSFTIELGNKRGSRIEYANARKNDALLGSEATKADIKIETILNLYRLRQVLNEKKLLSEGFVAFSKVASKLRSLSRLSSEQEASLTLFEIALEETKINESELFEEEKRLEHYFHVSTGHSLEEIRNYLPESPINWPKIEARKDSAASPDIAKLKSLASLAQREFEIQKSQAWPDINIGPSFLIEKEGTRENKMVGFNVQIPLPIFQVNGGGQAFAKSEYLSAQKNVALTTAEETHERFEQLSVYESSVNILNKTMKQKTIEQKHDRIEKLYLRGVISSSMFLDSLKQKQSYLKSRNNREMTAIKALWSIYKYDGKIFKEKI